MDGLFLLSLDHHDDEYLNSLSVRMQKIDKVQAVLWQPKTPCVREQEKEKKPWEGYNRNTP